MLPTDRAAAPWSPIGVVLVDRNVARRSGYREALQRLGCHVVDVARIAELERWPANQVVVTDAATAFWKEVGATRVVVIAYSGSDLTGIADAWVPHDFPSGKLVDVLFSIGVLI